MNAYERARETDKWLPEAISPPPSREIYKAFKAARNTDPRYLDLQRKESDLFCEERLAGPGVVSLREPAEPQKKLFVGERSARQSQNILRKLRESACKKVYAVEVEEAELGGEAVLSVGRFVLELPEERSDRMAVRKLVGPWIRAEGFELEPELGQRYLFFSMK